MPFELNPHHRTAEANRMRPAFGRHSGLDQRLPRTRSGESRFIGTRRRKSIRSFGMTREKRFAGAHRSAKEKAVRAPGNRHRGERQALRSAVTVSRHVQQRLQGRGSCHPSRHPGTPIDGRECSTRNFQWGRRSRPGSPKPRRRYQTPIPPAPGNNTLRFMLSS